MAGIIGAMLAGAPVVSCQFQTISLLPAKMFRGRGKAAKPQILRKSASGNTQYKLTQASTFPGQGASPLTRWGGCPQPANGRCPLTPAVRCRPCTPAQRASRPLYSRPAMLVCPIISRQPASPDFQNASFGILLKRKKPMCGLFFKTNPFIGFLFVVKR